MEEQKQTDGREVLSTADPYHASPGLVETVRANHLEIHHLYSFQLDQHVMYLTSPHNQHVHI